jgi:hypothetical protein
MKELGSDLQSCNIIFRLSGSGMAVYGGIATERVLSPGPGPNSAWNSANNEHDKKNSQLKYFTQRVTQQCETRSNETLSDVSTRGFDVDLPNNSSNKSSQSDAKSVL